MMVCAVDHLRRRRAPLGARAVSGKVATTPELAEAQAWKHRRWPKEKRRSSRQPVMRLSVARSAVIRSVVAVRARAILTQPSASGRRFSFPEIKLTHASSDPLFVCTVRLSQRAPAVGRARVRRNFTPRTLNDPATGEQFHIEGSAGFWSPERQHVASASEALGIVGSDDRFQERSRAAPISASANCTSSLPSGAEAQAPVPVHPDRVQRRTATLKRDIVFNGQRYSVGLPVNSELDWKAYRFGYEYDFIARNRGFAGVLLDVKYTDVTRVAAEPARSTEFTHAQGADPGDRRHRARLRRPEHLDHRRADRRQDPGQRLARNTRRTTPTSTSTAR